MQWIEILLFKRKHNFKYINCGRNINNIYIKKIDRVYTGLFILYRNYYIEITILFNDKTNMKLTIWLSLF